MKNKQKIKKLEGEFAARNEEIAQLVEDIMHISDGLPNGSVLVGLMTASMMLFEAMGISKKDACGFFREACEENMVQDD
jgi:hypothetical protein